MENWKAIPGYKGLYMISSYGKVISHRGRIIKLRVAVNGYMRVWLYKNSDKSYKPFTVHRLVAECFIGNPDSKPWVNHKDGDKQNNKVSNLEWCTQSENMKHAFNEGLQLPNYGEKNGFAKLKDADAIAIREKYSEQRLDAKLLAEQYSVSPKTIRRIVSRKTFIHI